MLVLRLFQGNSIGFRIRTWRSAVQEGGIGNFEFLILNWDCEALRFLVVVPGHLAAYFVKHSCVVWDDGSLSFVLSIVPNSENDEALRRNKITYNIVAQH